jgi:hypothetical protein
VCTLPRSRGALRINSVLTGISGNQLADLLVLLARPWEVANEGRCAVRRGHDHSRGGGRYHELALINRLVVTLAALRRGLTHDVLAALWDVDRSTVTRAIAEVCPAA